MLKVSPNGRYLLRDDAPFFYLADTAWELLHRLDRSQTELYLRNRAAKGFTVIQSVLLAEIDGLRDPNPEGQVPLHHDDPTQPNEQYFQHVDFVIDRAAELGLVMALLPTWGDKVNRKWGIGPEIFNSQNARIYGAYLGRRYADRSVIWILGGDRIPETPEQLAIWRAMAGGLQQGCSNRHLITYHPGGGSHYFDWSAADDWLSIYMFQSGHGEKDLHNHDLTLRFYHTTPTRPVLDGEPRYEDLPVRFWDVEYAAGWRSLPVVRWWNRLRLGWFDAYDVRQAAYWSLLSGACGHTYGNNSVWQMWQPGRRPYMPATSCSWQAALDRPGAVHMSYVKKLLTDRPFWKLIPDQSLLVDAATGKTNPSASYCCAARAADNSFALVYIPTGLPTAVDLTALSQLLITASWYNPRTGATDKIGQFTQTQTFVPPSRGRGQDWLLVLDNASGAPHAG